MRHKVKKVKLNRRRDHRRGLVRNLLTALFTTGSVKTTNAKAKALQSGAEALFTKIRGKEPREAIRALKQVLYTEEAQKRAMEYIEKISRPSGFTRSTKIGYRAGDNALIMQVDFITDAA